MAQDKYSQNRQLAYDLLKQEGYTDIGDSAEELFKNKANSELAYNLLSQAGYTDIGKDYNEFANMLYGPSRPASETERVGQPKRQNNPQAVAEGGAMFQQMRASSKPEVSTMEDIPQEAQAYMQTSPAKGKGPKEIEIDTLKAAEKENADFVAEYDRRWKQYQDDTNNELSGPEVDAEKKWLDENNKRYREAKNDVERIGGLQNLATKEEDINRIDAKKKAISAYTNPQEIVARGMTPFGGDNTGKSGKAKDYADFEAAKEIYNMAEQTLKQGSKADPGYEGGWLEQSWTAAKQFVEGAANNIDRGSLTFGLSEGTSLMAARRAGDKSNEIVNDTLKDMGYSEADVNKLLQSVDEDTKKLNSVSEELNTEAAELETMKVTLEDMQRNGASQSQIRAYAKQYNDKVKAYNAKLKNEYEPLIVSYEKDSQQYEAIMSAVDSAVENGLSDGEKAILDALEEFTDAKIKRANDVSVASAAGAGAEQSAEFMLDFILTGGLAKAGTKAATKLTTRRIMKKLGAEAASKVVRPSMGARILTDAGVAAARTAAMFPRNLAAYGEQLTQMTGKDQFGRYNFDRSHLNAALNTALTQYIEYWSEGFGEYFGAAEQALFKNVTKAAPRTMIGKTLKGYRGSIGSYLDNGKFDGMFNEMLEEVVGSGFNALAGWMSNDRVGDKEAMKDFFSGEQLATLALSFLPMSAISASTNLRAYNKMKTRYNDSTKVLNPFIESGAISREELDELVTDIENKTPEEIKDKIVEISDKARKSNGGYLPQNFAQSLLGYVEGTFSMSLNSEAWGDSQEKMRVVNAYTNQYDNPNEQNAWDLAQAESAARDAALAQGIPEDILELDAYDLARRANSVIKSVDENAGQALMTYAEVKAANTGLKDGYDAETAEYNRTLGDAIREKCDVDGNIITATTAEGEQVYITSKDVTVGPDGKLITPTGADGLVSFVSQNLVNMASGQQAKANLFSGAQLNDTETFLFDKEMAFADYREALFQQAKNTISPAGMSRAIGQNVGGTLYVTGSGAYEPVTVVRMTNDGANVVITGDKDALEGIAMAAGINSPGGTNLEIPVQSLYPMLATNDDGSLSTDVSETETESFEPAEETETTPVPGDIKDLEGQFVTIDINGTPTEILVGEVGTKDVDGNKDQVEYYTKDESGEYTDINWMPIAELQRALGMETTPTEETSATEIPVEEAVEVPEPEPAPAEETASGIPVDEKTGEPIYDALGITPEMAYDDIYGKLSEKNADMFVIEQAKDADIALAAAQKLVNEGDKEKAEIDGWDKKAGEGLNAFLKRQADAKAKVDERIGEAQASLPELQRKKAFWDELRVVAEDNTRAAEEAAKRQALIDKYGVDTSKFDLTPETPEEAVAEYLGNSEKIIDLEDAKKETLGRSKTGRVPAELFRHLGNGGILTKNGGKLIADVANDIVSDYADTMAISQDEVRDIIIDYLARYTKSEMRNLIFDNRLDAAIAERDAQEAPEEIPAEEAVGEAPEGTEVPAEEPAPEVAAPTTGPEGGAQISPKNEPPSSESPEESVPSQKKGLPKTRDEAVAAANAKYGEGSEGAKRAVRLWELTHKKRSSTSAADNAQKTDGLTHKSEMGSLFDNAQEEYEPLTEEELDELRVAGQALARETVSAGDVKFKDFFRAIVGVVGDEIRPYVKSFYTSLYGDASDELLAQLDDLKTVRDFDIYTSIEDENEQDDSESGVPESTRQGEESAGTDDSGSNGQPDVEGGRGGEVPGDSTGNGGRVASTGEGGTTTEGRTAGGEGTSVSGDDENAGPGTSGGVSSGRGSGRRGSSVGGRGTSGRKQRGNGGESRGRSGEPGGSVDTDGGNEGRGVLTQEQYEEERGKSYQESKKELAEEGDVASLKALAAKLESEISDLDDLTAEKAIKEGQLSAVYDRLRDIFAEKNKQTINLDEEKIAYVPVCDPEGKYAIGSVVPAGSAESIYNALRKVEQEEGKSLAEFVKDELGYSSLEEMFSGLDDEGNPTNGLASEQVDGVALAIHNLKKGGQCIIGDMTGVGKGRQGAAVVRWAIRHKKKCLYVTKNADLFSDAYRDLADIGSGDIKPMAIGDSKKGVIVDSEGRKVVTNPSSDALKKLYESGDTKLEVSVNGRKVPEKYDYVLTNYDQLNAYVSEKSKKSVKDKAQWFRDYAKDAIVILDESHLASGGSNRGHAFQEIVQNSAGVTFMSATFAKRPENMVLYALKSSLGKSNIPVGQVISDIYEYGTPMQEMLAEGFFSSGEMIRRERDFTGVVNNWPTAEEVYTPEEIRRDRDTYDSVMELMDDIILFQNKYIAPIIREEEQPYKAHNKAVEDEGEGTKVTFYNTPASGQISNITSLLLLDFRSKKASEMALASIKKGEKPVVVVDNTNESYIDEIEDGAQTANFASIIRRRFDSIFRYSRIEQDIKNGKEVPKQEGGRRTTTLDVTPSLSPEALAQVKIIEEKLGEFEKDGRINNLPLSPIDDIASRIKSGGYKVGEITGRKSFLKNEDGEWAKENRDIDGKKEARLFNGGSSKNPLPKENVYDALILNRAGATGISLHSSVKFGDQKQRHELFAQTALNVDDVVQVKGRTDRTGQAHRSIYTYIPSPIPVEQRFLASLKRKLASLDANTSATQKVSSNKVEAVDMENKYGDEVARDYLVANPQINSMLPAGKRLDESDLASEPTDLMHNLLIGLQRLPCATQESILADLTENYQIKIDYLNQNGTNDLESTVKDLNATTIDKAVFVKGVDESSPSVFLNDANIERVEVDILKEPVRSPAIWQTAKREGAFLTDEKREEKGYSDDMLTDPDYPEGVYKKAAEMVNKMIVEREEKNKKRVDDFFARLKETMPKLPDQSQEAYDKMIAHWPSLQELKANLEVDLNAYKKELETQLRYLKSSTGDYLSGNTGLVVGKPYLVPVTDYAGEGALMGYGRFMGFKVGNGKPNSIMAVFAVRDSRAKVEIPVVKERATIYKINKDSSQDDILTYMGAYSSKSRVDKDDMHKWDEWWDGQIPKNSTRQLRYMLTGNITLGAGKVGKYKGGIILFTRKDAKTGEVTNDRGMLLAEDFDPENFPIKEKLTKEELWNSDKTFSDNDISIDVRRSGNQAIVIVNEMRYTDKKGVRHTVKVSTRKKEFDKDETWQRLVGNDPYITRTQVYYTVDEKNVEELLNHLYYRYGFAKTRMFIMPDSSERVDRIVYTDKPYNEVIDEFGKKYGASSEYNTTYQIRKALEQYKRNINDDALKEKIKELVQLRQAYIRKSIANEESWRLAWAVIENMEKEAGAEDKNLRDMYGYKKAALLEELSARGVKGRTMHLEQGEISVDRIKELFDKLNKDKFNAEIAKRVFAKVKKSNPETMLNEKARSDQGGHSRGNLLYYNWKYMNSDWITDQMKANTLLHEAAHNITNYVEFCVDNGYEHLLTQDLVDAKNELDNIFSVIKNDDVFDHGTWVAYGTKDWDELIAEAVSNPDFRADLAKIKLAVRMRSGFLTFSKATGNEPEGTKTISALDAVMERVNTLIDNFNENGQREAFRGSKAGARGADEYYRFVEEGMWGPDAEGYSENEQTHSPAFKAWFGDWENNPENASKVVNENGEPMVMYHGTSNGGFTKFDTLGSNFGLFGTGSYFTNNESVAEGYTKKGNGESPKVYPVYLNVRRPLNMDEPADVAEWKAKAERISIPAKYFDNCKTNADCFNALRRYCDDEGMSGSAGKFKSEAGEFISDFIEHSLVYDGITHEGGRVTGGQKHRVYIVFRPQQIKSATENSGRYDSENGDIRFREADLREGEEPAPVVITNAERRATNHVLDTMEEELGVPIHRVSREQMPRGHKTDKGYYDPKTGEMTICMDNVTDERDAVATVLHETVGHHGLRQLFGDRFNDAMVRIYAALDSKGRVWVNSYIARHPNADNTRAVEEYLSHLAESGDFKNVVWQRIKEIISKIVDAIFGTDGFLLTDNELNYILRASYEHLKNPNWLDTIEGKALDTLMKRALGINETDPHRPTDPEGPGAGLLYRDGGYTGVADNDYNSKMQLKGTAALTENQNADLPVKIGMEAMMAEYKKKHKKDYKLREDEDYLTRHNLASSRAETEAHNFDLFHFAPLLEQVRVIQNKLLGKKATKQQRQDAYERILDYMYAVSGLERTRYKNAEIEAAKRDALTGVTDPAIIAQITKRFDDQKKDWAGLTSLMGLPAAQWQLAEVRAQKLVDDFKTAVSDDAALKELWKRVRSCTDYSLNHARKYGLLTREEYEKLHGTATQPRMWEYYLPLRGFDENTAEEIYSYANFTNPSPNSVVVKKMNGRWTKADNPLANILNIAETEIVQGNDNWAKQALLRFVDGIGDNTLLAAAEPWYVKNPATGKWSLAEPIPGETLRAFEARMKAYRALPTPLAKKGRNGLKLDNIMANKAHRNEHAIRLKVDGMDRMIWVNGDPALAKAVSGIGRAKNLQWLRRASRVLSNLFTTYSLDFTAKNLIRDTIYSRVALLVKEDKAYRHQFRKNWYRNLGYGAFAYPMVSLAAQWESGELQRKPRTELTKREKMFIDFMTDGGQTGYTIINSVNDIKKSLERSMRMAGQKTSTVTVPILGHIAKGIKTLNEAFELLTRFTAYETSRDMGRSGQRSASDAKEISVNFNRRGAQSGQGIWGNIAAYLGATHYFYNAGVQGFDNYLHLFKVSPKKMGIATGTLILMGILMPLINGMLAGSGDGGDEDWYWNLPEWVRRNNIILGWKNMYVAVPLPVEFRAIYGMGDIIGAAFCYQKTPHRTFGSLAGDMISTAAGILPVNPVEGYTGNGNLGDAALRAVAPDAAMFFVDWATNRDYTGRPLWKENPFSETVPKSQGAYASTPKGMVLACQKLAEISGGNIDIAPGLVRDFANNYGGGFFRLAEDASKILTGVFDDDPERPLRWDNVPFFSGFTGHIDEDRSNSFASSALYEYKNLSEGNVKKLNAICGTDELTSAMVYGEAGAPEGYIPKVNVPEEYASKVNMWITLHPKDYELGKMYREGMNNEYVWKQNLKTGEWYKSRELKRKGVSTLKKEWKELREQWASMPSKTQEEKDAKEAFSLQVQEAWHLYYDAEADLAQRLMDYEYGKNK